LPAAGSPSNAYILAISRRKLLVYGSICSFSAPAGRWGRRRRRLSHPNVYDKSNKTYVSKSAQNGKIATFDAEL